MDEPRATGARPTSTTRRAAPQIIAQLPGFNGDADWHAESFDLSAYAGKTVLLRFRLMTDGATLGNGGAIEAGWQVDDVKVGGVLVSDGTLAGWGTEAPPIAGYTLQLISIGAKHGKQATLVQVPLKSGRTYSLDAKFLFRFLLGRDAETVAMLVMYDEPTESIARYAPYSLKVNGVLQPGAASRIWGQGLASAGLCPSACRRARPGARRGCRGSRRRGR